jgi:FADH2 O2-dependent halogenase
MGFVDPLLSTGFPLVLLGLNRLLAAIDEKWGQTGLEEAIVYSTQRSFDELQRVSKLIKALYQTMGDFRRFATLTRLYFAAVSYAESARRLARLELAGDSFLMGDDKSFASRMDACLRLALTATVEDLERAVDEVILPIDVAGLTRRDRRNWLPVDPQDLFAAASKLHCSRREIEDSLQRSGFYAPPALAASSHVG